MGGANGAIGALGIEYFTVACVADLAREKLSWLDIKLYTMQFWRIVVSEQYTSGVWRGQFGSHFLNRIVGLQSNGELNTKFEGANYNYYVQE